MDDRRQHPRRDTLTAAEADRVADVFTQHRAFIEAVARQNAPGPDHVPDIVQAVGIQVCRGLNGYRGDAEITTWLYRVTVNTARDYYRSERRQILRARECLGVLAPVEPVIDPDEQAIQAERLTALHEAVERLRPNHRTAICNELSGDAVETNRTAKHRARRQLKELLADDPRLKD